MEDLSAGIWTSAATFFGQFAPILYPLLGLLVFLIVAGAFVAFFKGKA